MRMMAFPPVPDVPINDAARVLGSHQITKITTGTCAPHWWSTRLTEYSIWEEPDSDCNCVFLHTSLGDVVVLRINPEMSISGHVTGVALSTQGNLGRILGVESMEPMGPVEDLPSWDTEDDEEEEDEEEEEVFRDATPWDDGPGDGKAFDNYMFRVVFDNGHAHISFAHPRGRGRRPAISPALKIITPEKYAALKDPLTDVAHDVLVERIVRSNPHAADWLPMRFADRADMLNTLFKAPPVGASDASKEA